MKNKKQKSLRNNIHPASFRDPCGFLFWNKGRLLRQINKAYKQNYELLIESGLYKYLVKHKLLISHDELNLKHAQTDTAYKVIKPEQIQFISYPYEWCFSQLKDAALLTLKIQNTALAYNMGLKDASAYNIQFYNGKPILIDTLSFEKYEEGKPWIAYRQFCQHFLAPLALLSYTDIRLGNLLRIYIDGIPLDLTSKLLPKRSWLNGGILSHLHLHAKTQKRYSDRKAQKPNTKNQISKKKLLLLLNNLTNTIQSLQLKNISTEWGDYYKHTNYSKKAFKEKKQIVSNFIDKTKPKTVWDLGANTGEFSRIASNAGAFTLSFDIDPLAVERNYKQVKQSNEKNILPLIMDFFNPSPSLGWANNERDSLIQRGGSADTVLALALLHHLAISNNVPLEKTAELFSKFGKYLIIEFVPKEDSQVQKLLSTREDIFTDYTQENFERVFRNYYKLIQKEKITDSKRILYLLKSNNYH